MTTSTTVNREQQHPADAIADVIEQYGWVRHQFGNEERGFCVSGAGAFLFGVGFTWCPEYRLVCERLGIDGVVSMWNDQQKSKEDVIKALRGEKNG